VNSRNRGGEGMGRSRISVAAACWVDAFSAGRHIAQG
jgi:hypothetical protein